MQPLHTGCQGFRITSEADGTKSQERRGHRATAGLWKMLTIAEKRCRRLKAPELMRDVYDGAQDIDGMAIEALPLRRLPPDDVYTPVDVSSDLALLL